MNERPPYTAKEVQSMRRALAGIRGEAMNQGVMDYAVILSHVITVLWDYNVRVFGHEFAAQEEMDMPAELGDNCPRNSRG